MNPSSTNSNHISKQLEYVKQQEQLRALGNSRTNPKPLSADSMIENLLSKKETFQKRSSEPQQKQEVAGWLCNPVPAMYSQVWASVQSANGLADTPTLSSLLMSSGLSTDLLAYIWSLANRTVPGALTQQEVHLVLALVALTQSGYHVDNLETVSQLPQAPIPALDLTLLPPPRQQLYPTPLSVMSLPEPIMYNWVSPEIQSSNNSDKIGVSYVSSGPIVSPKLLTENPPTAKSLSFTEFNINNSIDYLSDTTTNTSIYVDSINKSTHSKRPGNNYNFSFPSLNESPSHIAHIKPDSSDPFDDEFTDFQSADFNTVVSTTPSENHDCPVIEEDDDEFTNFQKAPPKFDDDLSVLVIDGKNIPSAQSLWVADNPVPSKKETLDSIKSQNLGVLHQGQNLIESMNQSYKMKVDISDNRKEQREKKYDVFQEIDDGRFSVFHNPLPDDEEKHIASRLNSIENTHSETKSIFSHSLIGDSEQSLDFIKVGPQLVNMDVSKSNVQNSNISDEVDVGRVVDDDEFCTFQNFPVSFPDLPAESVDKYDVFRTTVFTDNSIDSKKNVERKPVDEKFENPIQVNFFGAAEMNLFNMPEDIVKCDKNTSFGSIEEKTSEDIKFDNFKDSTITSPKNHQSNIDDLFSSLAISEKKNNSDTMENSLPDFSIVEDRYKALRLLEENSNEIDEFGEFSAADLSNDNNQPPKMAEKPSIQERSLESCLNLLKDGLSTLSRASSQDVVSEVLRDPRASTYLDCLLEVHLVSERITSNMESHTCVETRSELRRIWDQLGPYFTHTEHNHLPETLGAPCGVCRSSTGPSPVTFGAMSFHSPCANLYLHCVEPVLPNISPVS